MKTEACLPEFLAGRGRRGGIILAGVLALWLANCGGAGAQDAAAEQQRLYEHMVRQPTNYDATFAFVKVATERGDYEAAIGALERLLFYNADQPLVKYELGSLYFRLGSYALAKRYFLEARAAPDVDAATKARIEASLQVVDKELQPSLVSRASPRPACDISRMRASRLRAARFGSTAPTSGCRRRTGVKATRIGSDWSGSAMITTSRTGTARCLRRASSDISRSSFACMISMSGFSM